MIVEYTKIEHIHITLGQFVIYVILATYRRRLTIGRTSHDSNLSPSFDS
jgi:hypothetical protein